MIDSEKIKVKIDKRITDITTTKVQKEYLNNVINTSCVYAYVLHNVDNN